jgi:hypothetical protein
LDYSDIVPTGTTVLYEASGGAQTLAALQGNGLMTHGITGNPLFINASGTYSLATDFTLQSASPAIWAGTNVSLTTDYGGRQVHQPKPSMGAWEWFSNGCWLGKEGFEGCFLGQ